LAVLFGFSNLRFHDLRRAHAALLLDRGAPLPIVAKRIGDNQAARLRTYANRKSTADNSVSAVIGALAAGFLKT
jgi:integrase